MTTRNPLLDPDDPSHSAVVETGLAAGLDPQWPDAPVGAAMRQRLLDRARADVAAGSGVTRVRQEEGAWRPLVDGVRVKVLHESARVRSVLIELAAGTTVPTHRHHQHEECIVLRGTAQLGDIVVERGDFHVAPAGSRHGRVSSPDGALLYLRGVPIGDTLGVARDLVTAWLPGKGPAPITVRADEGAWDHLLPGVQSKHLWQDGAVHSSLLRMQPGARLPAHSLDTDEECLLLEGEVFVDDTLLRAGDYQFAPAGSQRRELASDVGALFFVHGAAVRAAQRT